MPGTGIVFVVNPAAGKGRAGREAARVRASLERAGLAGDWRRTTAPDEGIDIAEQAARQGAGLVVAIGGDGTANEIVRGLMRVPEESRPPLAVVPAGSGNDYARLIGMTAWDFDGAAETLRARRERRLDAGDVNGRFFGNGVGLGFDGEVAADAARLTFIGGFAAYLVAVFRVLATWRNFRLTADVDGEILEGPTILTAVTIGPASGGGFRLTPDAKPDDGLFDLCRLGDFGKVEALRNLPKALNGSHVRLAKATLRRGHAVTLRADRPLTAHVDGNVIRGVAFGEPLRFRMHPRALRVVGRWSLPGGERNGAQGRN